MFATFCGRAPLWIFDTCDWFGGDIQTVCKHKDLVIAFHVTIMSLAFWVLVCFLICLCFGVFFYLVGLGIILFRLWQLLHIDCGASIQCVIIRKLVLCSEGRFSWYWTNTAGRIRLPAGVGQLINLEVANFENCKL